jgi:hypothetical protein
VAQFEAVLARVDPGSKFGSDMARRLSLKHRRTT